MMVWMFFANLFDPAKVAATEQVMTDRSRGDVAQRRAATAAAPPKGRSGGST